MGGRGEWNRRTFVQLFIPFHSLHGMRVLHFQQCYSDNRTFSYQLYRSLAWDCSCTGAGWELQNRWRLSLILIPPGLILAKSAKVLCYKTRWLAVQAALDQLRVRSLIWLQRCTGCLWRPRQPYGFYSKLEHCFSCKAVSSLHSQKNTVTQYSCMHLQTFDAGTILMFSYAILTAIFPTWCWLRKK